MKTLAEILEDALADMQKANEAIKKLTESIEMPKLEEDSDEIYNDIPEDVEFYLDNIGDR